MARNPDGKVLPGITSRRARKARKKAQEGIGLFETRGRRSFSQKSRDLSERLRSLGDMFQGSPHILETVVTGAFVGLLVYFLRPRVTAIEYTGDPKAGAYIFKGKPIVRIDIDYPDVAMARNAAILTALIVAPDIGGDIGSLIAPAATAGIFATWIDKTFVPETIPAYDLAFGPEGFDPFHSKGGNGPYDVTLNFYTKILIRRFLRGVFVAVALFMMLRFIRHLGRN